MKRKAFTLIELLITIIIIGVLSGIILFAMSSSTEKANATACLGEREKIKTAFSTQLANKDNFADAISEVLGGTPAVRSGDVDETNKHVEYTGLCKDGGTYIIDYVGGMLFVKCSYEKHGGDDATAYRAAHPETGDGSTSDVLSGISGHTGNAGGTTSGGSSGGNSGSGSVKIYDTGLVVTHETWPSTNSAVGIKQGETFYDSESGNYYVAVSDFTINVNHNLSYYNNYELYQLLPTIVNGDITKTGSTYSGYSYVTLNNGQIVKFDNDYYVFYNGYSGSKSYYLENNKIIVYNYNAGTYVYLDPSIYDTGRWIKLE